MKYLVSIPEISSLTCLLKLFIIITLNMFKNIQINTLHYCLSVMVTKTNIEVNAECFLLLNVILMEIKLSFLVSLFNHDNCLRI